MLDFPASPSVGQKYPASPVAGIPTYTWDGEKWTTQGGSIVSASPGTLLPLMDAKPALVGVSTNFSREDHVHPSDTSRAPFDAMAYSGMQVNGDFVVSQERGAAPAGTSGQYVCDGWRISFSGALAIAAGVTPSALFPGFASSLGMPTSTALASLGATDHAQVYQTIEGYRIARLAWGTANAQPITLCFWSAHHRTGLWSGVISNGGGTRSYAFTYTHNVADVAQFNIVTMPGDTTGTWATDNTAGLVVHFAVASGSTYIAPSANTWLAGNYVAAPGQSNGVAATSDLFRLTGVIVLPGNEAPSAARSPFVMRSYDQELVTCMRYYEQLLYPSSGVAQALPSALLTGTFYYVTWLFKVRKRAAPTFVLPAGSSWVTNIGGPNPGLDAIMFNNSVGNYYLNGTLGAVAAVADARL